MAWIAGLNNLRSFRKTMPSMMPGTTSPAPTLMQPTLAASNATLLLIICTVERILFLAPDDLYSLSLISHSLLSSITSMRQLGHVAKGTPISCDPIGPAHGALQW